MSVPASHAYGCLRWLQHPRYLSPPPRQNPPYPYPPHLHPPLSPRGVPHYHGTQQQDIRDCSIFTFFLVRQTFQGGRLFKHLSVSLHDDRPPDWNICTVLYNAQQAVRLEYLYMYSRLLDWNICTCTAGCQTVLWGHALYNVQYIKRQLDFSIYTVHLTELSIPTQYCTVYTCTVGHLTHGGINGAAQVGEFDLPRWRASVVYITLSRRTVRLGSLLGLYEKFPIKK